eukprot:Rhum_TRINITY_DN11644_c0_g1::Rhum_TRINITY_DN11644_c0_g1_i1::g.45772::m.45772
MGCCTSSTDSNAGDKPGSESPQSERGSEEEEGRPFELDFLIHKATGLKTDKKCQPYAHVEISDGGKQRPFTRDTKIAYGQNPEWEEVMEDVKIRTGQEITARITVYHKNFLGAKNFLGYAELIVDPTKVLAHRETHTLTLAGSPNDENHQVLARKHGGTLGEITVSVRSALDGAESLPELGRLMGWEEATTRPGDYQIPYELLEVVVWKADGLYDPVSNTSSDVLSFIELSAKGVAEGNGVPNITSTRRGSSPKWAGSKPFVWSLVPEGEEKAETVVITCRAKVVPQAPIPPSVDEDPTIHVNETRDEIEIGRVDIKLSAAQLRKALYGKLRHSYRFKAEPLQPPAAADGTLHGTHGTLPLDSSHAGTAAAPQSLGGTLHNADAPAAGADASLTQRSHHSQPQQLVPHSSAQPTYDPLAGPQTHAQPLQPQHGGQHTPTEAPPPGYPVPYQSGGAGGYVSGHPTAPAAAGQPGAAAAPAGYPAMPPSGGGNSVGGVGGGGGGGYGYDAAHASDPLAPPARYAEHASPGQESDHGFDLCVVIRTSATRKNGDGGGGGAAKDDPRALEKKLEETRNYYNYLQGELMGTDTQTLDLNFSRRSLGQTIALAGVLSEKEVVAKLAEFFESVDKSVDSQAVLDSVKGRENVLYERLLSRYPLRSQDVAFVKDYYFQQKLLELHHAAQETRQGAIPLSTPRLRADSLVAATDAAGLTSGVGAAPSMAAAAAAAAADDLPVADDPSLSAEERLARALRREQQRDRFVEIPDHGRSSGSPVKTYPEVTERDREESASAAASPPQAATTATATASSGYVVKTLPGEGDDAFEGVDDLLGPEKPKRFADGHEQRLRTLERELMSYKGACDMLMRDRDSAPRVSRHLPPPIVHQYSPRSALSVSALMSGTLSASDARSHYEGAVAAATAHPLEAGRFGAAAAPGVRPAAAAGAAAGYHTTHSVSDRDMHSWLLTPPKDNASLRGPLEQDPLSPRAVGRVVSPPRARSPRARSTSAGRQPRRSVATMSTVTQLTAFDPDRLSPTKRPSGWRPTSPALPSSQRNPWR